MDDDNVTWLGSFLSLQDPNKPQLERSLSTFDIPTVLQFSYSYDLPVGRGKAFLGESSRVLDAVLGGGKTNGIGRGTGGRPIAFSTYDGKQLPTYGSQQPNLTGTPKRSHQKGWINNYFTNPGVLQLPPVYALGNAPRTIGSARTLTSFSVNLSMEKDFSRERLRKDMRLELRLEAQNAFNHPIFGTPDSSIDDSNFGTITYTFNLPREGQLGVKVYF